MPKNLTLASKSLFRSSSLHILLFITLAATSFACSRGPRRACEWLNADAIFIGRVIDTKPTKHKVGNDTWPGYSMTIAVEETLKGTLGQEVKVETGSGGGDCGTPLPAGKRLLIFAYKAKDETLWTGLGEWSELPPNDGPTYSIVKPVILGPIREALTFGKGSLYGRVSFQPSHRWDSEGRPVGWEPAHGVPNLLLHAASDSQTFTTRTVKDGAFEFKDLPNGRYTVTPDLDPSWTFDQHGFGDRYVKTIGDGSCAKVDFDMHPTTRLKGQVRVPPGQQFGFIPDLGYVVLQEVVAIPTGARNANDHSVVWNIADEDGTFDIWPIPPGDYYVGIDVRRPPTPSSPYLPTYYPGVSDKKVARIVHIEEGETKSIEFPLPQFASKREVHFIAVDASGKPMRELRISVRDPQRAPDAIVLDGYNAKLPADGSGSLSIFAGFSYKIFADHWDSATHASWCARPVLISPGAEPVEIRFVMDRTGSDCNLANLDKIASNPDQRSIH